MIKCFVIFLPFCGVSVFMSHDLRCRSGSSPAQSTSRPFRLCKRGEREEEYNVYKSIWVARMARNSFSADAQACCPLALIHPHPLYHAMSPVVPDPCPWFFERNLARPRFRMLLKDLASDRCFPPSPFLQLDRRRFARSLLPIFALPSLPSLVPKWSRSGPPHERCASSSPRSAPDRSSRYCPRSRVDP